MHAVTCSYQEWQLANTALMLHRSSTFHVGAHKLSNGRVHHVNRLSGKILGAAVKQLRLTGWSNKSEFNCNCHTSIAGVAGDTRNVNNQNCSIPQKCPNLRIWNCIITKIYKRLRFTSYIIIVSQQKRWSVTRYHENDKWHCSCLPLHPDLLLQGQCSEI